MKKARLSKLVDSSDDSQSEDGISCPDLRQHHWERCEFCDKVISNRYAMLKHNVSHIIIPLIKLTTHQCGECLHHFTSVEDVIAHIAKKHKSVSVSPITIKLEDKLNEEIPEILQSIVEKQVYVKCEDELKEVISIHNELNNKNSIILNNNQVYKEPVKEELINPKVEIPNVDRSSPTYEERQSIRQRLMFEEDIEDNLFKDLSADCQVSLETIYKQLSPEFEKTIVIPSSDESVNLETIDDGNGIDTTTGMFNNLDKVQEGTIDLLRHGKAIHYDILMESDVCLCRWCGKDFPNRYKLLQHEPIHINMRIKRKWPWPLCSVCERYISGNYRTLRLHMERNHPDKVDVNFHIKKCPKCSLRYHNFTKHLRHYHESYRCQCGQGFETSQLRDGHQCGRVNVSYTKTAMPSDLCNKSDLNGTYQDSVESKLTDDTVKPLNQHSSSVMKLCNMCFSFMKNYMQNRHNYDFIGEQSELGVRQICDKCNNKFFEVKLVMRKQILKDVPKKIKPNTNTERLKKIQSRLKMLKDRNKY